DFTLTEVGETATYTSDVTMSPLWNIEDLTAIAIIQTMSGSVGNYPILQAGSSQFSGLLPLFSSDRTEGPVALGVNFINNSFPQIGIDLYEWDFDGDGIFDSNEQNPYFVYDTPGTYDVTLQITVDGETAAVTEEDYITVTESSGVSGSVAGIWMNEYSPYIITDDTTVDEEASLLIEPGVTVITNGNSQIIVHGLLQADAMDQDPIIFTSDNTWKGMKFSGTQEDNILRNCEISKATLTGIKVEEAKVDILENKFYENSSSALGASIDVSSSDNVNIGYNIIANNTCVGLTGGIGCTNANPHIYNNIIVNNDGYFAGSISLKNGSNPTIQNNTIANNSAQNEFFLFDSFPILINNIIIKENTSIFQLINSLPTVSYSCVTGDYEGPGNIDDDPLFEAPSGGSGSEYDGLNALWYLTADSPCIDAGHPSEIYNDMEDPLNPGFALWPAMGTLRNDMGAYGGTGYVTVENDENLVPVSNVSQIEVYPNPFNPQTSIKLILKEADSGHPVELAVYNLRGQLVKTLIDNQTVVNGSSFSWNGIYNNGDAAASGIYFVRLKTHSGITAQKMLLLK
ncbi:MAG: right-handed parallel beta-helix repeat-containing protein, partial [Candidatus Cloacimonetes bacterium]|nr:right-handed parallel beta-helix repeat-containing protein [Candidatus Cloacimonadota bacterium]